MVNATLKFITTDVPSKTVTVEMAKSTSTAPPANPPHPDFVITLSASGGSFSFTLGWNDANQLIDIFANVINDAA